MKTGHSRRDFGKLMTLLICYLCGAKATAAETDNSSYWQHRIAPDVPRDFKLLEEAFAKEWEEANKPRPGVNHGGGILADLMWSTYLHERPAEFDPELSPRERKIVATVIQWLGTNMHSLQ